MKSPASNRKKKKSKPIIILEVKCKTCGHTEHLINPHPGMMMEEFLNAMYCIICEKPMGACTEKTGV